MDKVLCNNRFSVDWGGRSVDFMEISGLGMELDVVPYREGASKENTAALLPGQRLFPPVVLRRGIVQGDNDFYDWINTAQFQTIERRDVQISLLDEQHNPVVTWKLLRAFPSRLDYGPLQGLGHDVAIESLTLVHEGLFVQHR